MTEHFDTLLRQEITRGVQIALQEDFGGTATADLAADITAQLIPSAQRLSAVLITREPCVFVGKAWIAEVFAQLDPNTVIRWHASDGEHLNENDPICEISGNARAILSGERTAMNFAQTLSGTATQTARYAALLGDSPTQLLDTRKTLPGLRYGQKYAVACGGGHNHRLGLFDAFLIKENHIAACGSIAAAVNTAKTQAGDKLVEVEVESLDELQQAIEARADIIMLDNFSLAATRQAVHITNNRAKLEVSGNITDARLSELAAIGVDYISCGAITKHLQAIDLSLRVTTGQPQQQLITDR